MKRFEPVDESAALLKIVARFLRGLTSDEVTQLVHGNAKITLSTRSSTAGARRSQSVMDASELAGLMQQQMSREDGLAVLREYAPNRATLAGLARFLDLPVLKSDSVEKLRDRVIEGTIGYRLSSSAIRGDFEALHPGDSDGVRD